MHAARHKDRRAGRSDGIETITAILALGLVLLLGLGVGTWWILGTRQRAAVEYELAARQMAEAEAAEAQAKRAAHEYDRARAAASQQQRPAAADPPESNDIIAAAPAAAPDGGGWRKHVVCDGWSNVTVVAADFTGDGRIDLIAGGEYADAGGAERRGCVRLFVAPDWNMVVIDNHPEHGCIHGEVMDVDADGDADYVGARYSPGLVFWLERPAEPETQPWQYHLIDDQVDGIHGVLVGDVDRDGSFDLLATSALPQGPFANSLVWYSAPKNPREATGWVRYVLADQDAPGLSHYLGMGDVDGDGRPDVASAAKGGPTAVSGTGEWFAWWQAPADPRQPWTKHLLADRQAGATNIHPADLNGDGKPDFVASRGHGQGVIWFEAPEWKLHDIHPTLAGPHCLTVADIDNDGDIDAATCAKDDKLAAWFENDGHGKFTTHIVGTDQSAYDIRSLDMDGDNDVDLVIAGESSKNVVWYENPLR